MRALVLENYRDLRIRDVPEPKLGLADVLVEVKACGICGSDVHGYDGKTGRRTPPLIMGHEAAGVVAQVGTQARSFHTGDRVTFDSTISCGQCRLCDIGSVNLCDDRQVLGVSCSDYRRHGAFAEYVAVPEHIVYRLPPTFSYEKAALIEAVSIAVHAANITEIQPGSTVLVVGAGMIGLLAIQAFRIFGCKKVFAVDLEESKFEIARQLGADETFIATDPNISSRLIAANGGQEVDIAVDVVGAQNSITSTIGHVRRGGTVTLIGNLAPTVEIPLQSVVTRQLRLLGSCASAGEYGECISLMESGAIKVDPLISALAPLCEGAEWLSVSITVNPG